MKYILRKNFIIFVFVIFSTFNLNVAKAGEPTIEEVCLEHLQNGRYDELKTILATEQLPEHANDDEGNLPLFLFNTLLDNLYLNTEKYQGMSTDEFLKKSKAKKMLEFIQFIISEYHVKILQGIESSSDSRTILYGVFWSNKNIADAIISSFPVNYLLEVDTVFSAGLFYNFVWNTTPEIFEKGLKGIDLSNETYASKLLIGNLSNCLSDKLSVDNGFESAKQGLAICLNKLKILVGDKRLNIEVMRKIYGRKASCEELRAKYKDKILGVDAADFCLNLDNFILNDIPVNIGKLIQKRIN